MNALPWYKSPVYIGVLVNILAGVVNFLNLQDVVTIEFINNFSAMFFTVAGIIAAAVAEWKRRKSTVQPIVASQASADVKTAEMNTKQSGRVKLSFLACVLLAGGVGAVATLSGCATLTNPVKKAQTMEQKAYALYGSFVVLEETVAAAFTSGALPNDAKLALVQADKVAKPAADALVDAAAEVFRIRIEIEAGKGSEEQLVIALTNLDRYINELSPKVKALTKALKESK